MKKFSMTVSALFFLILVSPTVFAEDVTRSRTIEEFFKANTKLRVASDAVEAYKSTLNQMSLEVIKKASQLAEQQNRHTILERDIAQASEEVFRRAPIEVPELMEKITQLSIIELTKLANQVKSYQEELLEKKE
jgi:histone H3/H4